MTHPGELLSAFLDGELTPDEHRRVMRHLAGCEACANELAGLQQARAAVRSLIVMEPPPGLIPAPERPPAHRRIPVWVAAAAAAVLALFIGVATVAGPRTALEIRLDEISTQYGARTSLDPDVTPRQVIPAIPAVGGAE
jgi:anti-sigma factor RsiW